MSRQLNHIAEKLLHEVIALGSFSPQSFHIFLKCEPRSRLSELPAEIQRVFNHEFGHLLHYLTSYVGLKDLSFWVETVGVLKSPQPENLTDEEYVTWQAHKVLQLARSKQVLSIDEEYYYEARPEKFETARVNRNRWTVGDVSGRMFRTDGKLSDDFCFWATRFYIGDRAAGHSFLRIPIGIRTILEHVAKAIDFVGEFRFREPRDVLTAFGEEAYVPEMLHYYCLTHWVGPMMERRYGRGEIWQSFLVCGQLVLLLSEIPFDAPDVWRGLVKYAEQYRPDLVARMKHPHPSFLFPLLLRAAEKSSTDFDSNDLYGMENRLERLLKEIKLPPLSELRSHTVDLSLQICRTLDRSSLGKKLKNLVEWAADYAKSIGWANRFLRPSRNLAGDTPVPVIFQGLQVLFRWVSARDGCCS